VVSHGTNASPQAPAARVTTITTNDTQPACSAGVSTGGNTAGATGVTGTRVVFVGTDNVTLSQTTDASGATVSIKAAGGGAGQFSGGISNLGNTAGSTGVTGTRLVLVGTNNITLSGSTDARGGTISIVDTKPSFSAGVSTIGNTQGSTGVTGTRLVFAATDGMSLSQSTDANGGTITMDPGPALGMWMNMQEEDLGFNALNTNRWLIYPMGQQ